MSRFSLRWMREFRGRFLFRRECRGNSRSRKRDLRHPALCVILSHMPIFKRLIGKRAGLNQALELIKQMPQSNVTSKLVSALPNLAGELYSEARNWAKTLEFSNSLLADCVLDLELVGGFDSVATFAKDMELASLYLDAIVFSATGINVSGIPDEWEYRDTGTEKYHGIAKYSLAKKYFSVGDPDGWLFGKEYSRIVTGNADITHIFSVAIATLRIRKHGAWITEHALTGRVPSKEERDAFSAFESQAYKGLGDVIKSQVNS